MSNDCTGFSQWKMDIWLNLMHEKLDCRPEDWWYSKQWLNFHVWNTGTSTPNSTSSHFEPVQAVRRGTFRMCWGSRHFDELRLEMPWEHANFGDDYGMTVVRFLTMRLLGFPSLKTNVWWFCLYPKISFCCHFCWAKKNPIHHKTWWGFFMLWLEIISRGVSRIKFRHRSCGAKKTHQKITIKNPYKIHHFGILW